MLERLDKSFSSQRQIIQDISHELKTPLTVLKGQLQLALRRSRSIEEYTTILRSNLEEIEKIQCIIDEVLTLARLEAQNILMEMKPVDLNRLIRNVLTDIKVLAESKNIEIEFLARANVVIDANEVYLRRLFVNLLENAVKYNRPGGKIAIQTDENAENVIVDIMDNGIGIPENELPFIFNRFYRVDKARSSGEGAGLGLSIAKSIVQAHKGDITVKSHWGEGTTFSIHFPLSA
jgi:signal transduction histidine kinase